MKTVIVAVIRIALLMGAPVLLMEKQQSAFAQTVSSTVSTDPQTKIYSSLVFQSLDAIRSRAHS